MAESLGVVHIRKMGFAKLKIAYFHQDGLITGSAISLRNMITGLDSSLFEAHIVIPNDGPVRSIWEEVGIKVHIVKFSTFWTSPGPSFFTRSNLKQYRSIFSNKNIKSFVNNLKPDIIHINDKAAIQVGISLRKCGIPIIQHSRSAYHLTKAKTNKFLSSIIIKSYANHILCISEDEMQGFENMMNKTVLYNTVVLEEAEIAMRDRNLTRDMLGVKEKEIVIGMAENIGVHKGLLDFLKIARLVLPTNKNLRFLLVGKISTTDSIEHKGSYCNSLEYLNDFIAKYDYQDKIILTGYKPNPLNYIAAMDILIVSKAHGVLGRQPIEAQCTGTAVFAINGHSGKSKIIKNGCGGFLFDNLNQLIQSLNLILSDLPAIRNLGANGKIYASKNFNPELYNKSLTDIYYNLIH
jgi:glycosyltransferase involved in cell wall biosynthesis